LGVNKYFLKELGMEKGKAETLKAKTPYDIYPYEMANDIILHHKEVIQNNKLRFEEESIVDFRGETKHFNAVIAPLHDDEGCVIGTYGFSINITAQKETERLRRERVN
jgi:hypothetical protein